MLQPALQMWFDLIPSVSGKPFIAFNLVSAVPCQARSSLYFLPSCSRLCDALSIRFCIMIGTSDCFRPREHLSGIDADTVRQADICTRVVAPSQIEKSRGSCNMMLVRLCNIAEIFPKDGWVKVLLCFSPHGEFYLILPCTLAPRRTRRIRLAVKGILLGLSLVVSWKDRIEVDFIVWFPRSLSTSATQAGGSGQG